MNEILRRVAIFIYTIATFLWASFQSGKVSVPVVLNTSVNSIVLLANAKKQKMEIGQLNHRNIMWLAYLSNLKRPCGIIHNSTDTIIWVNNCSSLKVGEKTTETHLDVDKLLMLRDVIQNLRDVSVEERETSFFSMRYILKLKNKTIEVTDHFYKLIIGGETFRAFEQIEEREI